MNHFVLTKASSLQVVGTPVELNQGLVTLQAEAGQYLRLMNIDPAANEAISLWRKGDDLQILVNGELQVVVEDFYRTEGDGGLAIQDGPFIPQGAGDQVAGGSEGLVWTVGVQDDSGAAGWLADNGWLAGGAIGAVGAAYFLSRDEDDKNEDATLQISAHAGPFSSEAIVNVYNGSGQLIGNGSINSETGQVDINLGRYRGMAVIEVVDTNGDEGDYTSEATGELTDMDTSLRAMVQVSGRGTISYSVTPLTELAAREANLPDDLSELADNPLTSEQVAINEQIAALFGLEDLLSEVTTVLDDDYDATDGINAAELYGDILAILSGAEENLGSLSGMIDQLLNEITITDGVASLSAAGAQMLQQGQGTYESQGSGAQLTGQTLIENIPGVANFPSVVTQNELNDDQSLTLDILSVSVGDEVVIALGDQSLNITITEAMLNSDGSASVDFPAEQLSLLDDGTQTLSMSVNGEARQTTLLSLDLTRPSVSVSLDDSLLTIDANGVVESTKVTFSFSEAVTDFSIDDISLEQGSLTGLASQDGGLTWVGIYTPDTNVEDASLLIRVSGDYTDLNGNAPDGSSDLNTETAIDTQVPEAPVLSLLSDSGTANSDLISNQGTLSLSGVESGATVEYSLDGGTSWNTEFSAVEGENSVQARQIDAAGNTSAASESLTFTLDTSAAAPTVALSTDSGRSTSDLISNDGSLAVTATETGATLEYSIDGEESWSDSFTAVEGDNSVQVRQTDLAGNTSAASESLAFTLDTIAPVTPVISLSSDTGSSSGDRITKTDRLTLTGIEANAIVEYSINGGTTWSTEFDAVEGVNSVQVRQTDVAGNISAVSNTLTFTLDTTVPTAPTLTLTTDSGSSTSDKLTNDGSLTTTGAETGATVQYSTDNGSTWSSSFTAVEGENSVQVRQTDVAGNTSASRAITFTLDSTAPETLSVALTNDTSAPEVTGLKVPAQNTDADTGDQITSDASLTFTGQEDGAIIQYRIGDGEWGTEFEAVEGLNTVQVRQVDAAGNESDATEFTFTLDTSKPMTPNGSLEDDLGASQTDGVTSNGTILFGDASEDNLVYKYSLDGGDNWTVTTNNYVNLDEGTYAKGSILVIAIDEAGNESDAYEHPIEVVVDHTAPELTSIQLGDTALKAGETTTVTFTFSEAVTDFDLNAISSGQGTLSGLESDDGITWTATLTPLENTEASTNQISVDTSYKDIAGNAPADSAQSDNFSVDTQLPSVNRIFIYGGRLGAGDTASVEFEFSEYMDESSITLDDFSATYGTLSNLNVTRGEGATIATMTYTPNANIQDVSGVISIGTDVQDLAGNSLVAQKDSNSIDIDTLVPNAPGIELLSDTGSSTQDLITSDGTLSLTGVEEGATVQYSTDGTNWTGSFTAVEGTNSVQVRQTDIAGNTSAASETLTFTLDTQAPEPDEEPLASFVLASTTQLEAINNNYGYDSTPAITAVGTEGAYVVTWGGTDNVEDGGDYSVFVQAFNADGTANNVAVRLEAIGNTSGNDGDPQIIAVGTEGAYVVTWLGKDTGEDGNDYSVFVQVFNADGTTNGPAVRLEAIGNTSSSDGDPQITAVGTEGAYVVTWTGYDTGEEGTDYSVFVQAFNADGTTNGEIERLEAIGNANGSDEDPQITAVGTEGAYVVIWEGNDTGEDGVDYSVFVQAFNADGTTNGPAVRLEAIDNTSGNDSDPQITAVGTEGAYVVTWTGYDTGEEGIDQSVFVQAFNADGTTNGSSVRLEAIGNTSGYDYLPQITAVGTEGAYVATWQGQDTGEDGGDFSVFVQAFNADGTTNNVAVRLEAIGNTSGNENDPQITAVGTEGAYVVTWTGYDTGEEGTDYSVFVQAFSADGTTNGPVVRLEAIGNTGGLDEDSLITAVGTEGAYVVTWLGNDTVEAGGDQSIFVQAFNADGTTNGSAVRLEAIDNTSGYDYFPQITAVGTEGAYTITWNGVDSEGDLSVFVSLFTPDPATNNPLYDVYLAADADKWEYSLNGTDWVTGSGTQITLPDGTYDAGSILIRQYDLAGNITETSNGNQLVVDTVAPAAPGIELVADTGSSTDDLITNDGTLSISGIETGATVEYSLDGTNWTDSFSAVEGENTVQVRQTDAAGNVSDASSLTFTLDTVAPEPEAEPVASAVLANIVQLEAPDRTDAADTYPQITAVGSEGAYVVTWSGIDSEDNWSIFVQAFNADGTTNGETKHIETTVNGWDADEQLQITAVGTEGAYVVTWQGQDTVDDGNDYSVFVQAFNADGTTNGSAVHLEAIDNTSQFDAQPQITAVGTEGAYVVTWLGLDTVDDGEDYSVFVQAFNANGTTNGEIERLEAIGKTNGHDFNPQITAVGTEGAYVITWYGQDTSDAGGDYSVFVQAFNADGTTNGEIERLEAIGNTGSGDFSPQITAVGTEGAYVVTWEGYDTGVAGTDKSIFVQAFNADGTTNNDVVRLEAIGNVNGGDYIPQITAVGTEGGYVVTWQGIDTGVAGTDSSIFVQAFNADGTTNGEIERLEAIGNTSGYEGNPQITAIGTEGAYVVTWYGLDTSDAGSDDSVFVQAFNADGTTNGPVVRLEAIDNTGGGDYRPQITAVGDDGSYAVTWQGLDGEGDYSVFVSLFTLNPLTNNPLYDVYLAADADSWEYSIQDADFVAGDSSNQISLTDGTYEAGDIVIRQYDLAGNMTQTTSANQLVVDTTAPTVTLFTGEQGVESVEAGYTGLYVNSTEAGTVYFVNTDVTVTDLDSITNADDDQWNAVENVEAGTYHSLDTTGLAAGTYTLYAVDEAGNLSQVSEDSIEVTAPPAAVDVIINFMNGQSSMDLDGNREFDANTTYNIYLYVDAEVDEDVLVMEDILAAQRWSGVSNLGADDTFILAGDEDAIYGQDPSTSVASTSVDEYGGYWETGSKDSDVYAAFLEEDFLERAYDDLDPRGYWLSDGNSLADVLTSENPDSPSTDYLTSSLVSLLELDSLNNNGDTGLVQDS